MRKLPEIVVGVQYYRQPTPLPEEWDKDLSAIKEMGIEIVQLRPQWRWHERNEGELDFSDLDRLFDLARKHGLQVIFKFLLGCAPEWLFDRYDAARIKPTGEKMHPWTHGSVYIGGYTPCFDQDLVREKANRFIRASVRRYQGHPNLLAWNAWNEPRSSPAADCACEDSLKKFRAWLRARFEIIEKFNQFAGLAISGKGEDFSGIKAPVTYNDYVGWLLFRSWRAEMIADRMKWMYREIRKIDRKHPIMSHAGFCSVLQDVLEDTSNDYLNAKELDLYGSSCPNRADDLPSLEKLPKAYEAATVDLICSRLRGVSKPFWLNEIYANRGMYLDPLKPSFLRQTTYHAIASGAKGIIYWQYRSERLSTESNDAGLVRIGGEATDRSREVARLAKVLRKNRKELGAAETPKATVGILYDFCSDLISRIETAAPGPVKVEQGWREHYPYKNALRGIHLAFWELDIQADIVPSEECEKLLGYEVAYLPCPRMLSKEQARVLVKLVEQGGLLISEPSPGMRDANGWVSPDVPPKPLDELFGCREVSRVLTRQQKVLTTDYGKIVCPPELFLSTLARMELKVDKRRKRLPQSAKVIGFWENDGAAIVSRRRGTGRALLLGAPLGEIYFRTRERGVLDWIRGTLKGEKVKVERLLETRKDDLRVRRLVKRGDFEVLFIFNYREKPARASIRARGMRKVRELTDLGLKFKRAKGRFVTEVPAEEVLILKLSQ